MSTAALKIREEIVDLSRLDEPFEEHEIEWRVRTAGVSSSGKIWAKALAYITNRAIMNRLDDVAGKGGWKNELQYLSNGGVLCGISIYLNGQWVTKWDGSEPKASTDDMDAIKAAISRSMKRAAIQWGIGRYLYLMKENWAIIHKGKGGQYYQRENKKKGIPAFSWDPPPIPPQFLPTNSDRRIRAKSIKTIRAIIGSHVFSQKEREKAEDFINTTPPPTDERAQKFIESLRKHEKERKNEERQDPIKNLKTALYENWEMMGYDPEGSGLREVIRYQLKRFPPNDVEALMKEIEAAAERGRQHIEKNDENRERIRQEKKDTIETAIKTYKTPENVQGRIDTLRKNISLREIDSKMTNSGQARQEALRGNDEDQKEINLLMRAIAEMKIRQAKESEEDIARQTTEAEGGVGQQAE